MKEPELKFRARFVVVNGKSVSYADVPTTTLQSAVVKAKRYAIHPNVTCGMAEEWVKGHWMLRDRFPKKRVTT